MIRLTVERQGVARLPPTRGGLRIGGFCRHDSAVRHCQQGKGPIRANGKGLVFSRRAGDATSRNFANLRRDSSTLGEETHPRACGTRTMTKKQRDMLALLVLENPTRILKIRDQETGRSGNMTGTVSVSGKAKVSYAFFSAISLPTRRPNVRQSAMALPPNRLAP